MVFHFLIKNICSDKVGVGGSSPLISTTKTPINSGSYYDFITNFLTSFNASFDIKYFSIKFNQ